MTDSQAPEKQGGHPVSTVLAYCYLSDWDRAYAALVKCKPLLSKEDTRGLLAKLLCLIEAEPPDETRHGCGD